MVLGRLLGILPGHSDWVRSCSASVDGELLLTYSDDGVGLLWSSLETGKLLREFVRPDPPYFERCSHRAGDCVILGAHVFHAYAGKVRAVCISNFHPSMRHFVSARMRASFAPSVGAAPHNQLQRDLLFARLAHRCCSTPIHLPSLATAGQGGLVRRLPRQCWRRQWRRKRLWRRGGRG